MAENTINTIVTLLVVPVITLAVNWLIKRREGQTARAVAEIESRAENTDAAANYFRTANDMIAPLRQQIETVSRDNLSLQRIIDELKTDNKKRINEERRLRDLEQRRQQEVVALETENDRLKTRIQSLEKISLQQASEIKELRSENDRLNAKIERITQALETGEFKRKK